MRHFLVPVGLNVLKFLPYDSIQNVDGVKMYFNILTLTPTIERTHSRVMVLTLLFSLYCLQIQSIPCWCFCGYMMMNGSGCFFVSLEKKILG